MKNEALAGAATDLWTIRLEVIRIHEELEDDDGTLGLSNAVTEEKFTAVIELLEDLAINIDHANSHPALVSRQARAKGEPK